ncbi:MAG: hypothetical protein RLZZ272_205 [Actinomycetota bacterium]|jgi:hypothetical protein
MQATQRPTTGTSDRARTTGARTGRRTATPVALLLAALLAGACSADGGTDAAPDFEDPSVPADAPGVEPEETDTAPADGADVTATQIGLPPLEVENRRGYVYRIELEIPAFSTEVALGDPGRTLLLVEAQLDLAVANVLDDRPAPFLIEAGSAGADFDVLFPMERELAAELHERRNAELPGQGSEVPYLSARSIDGEPFLRSIPRASGSSLVAAGRAFEALEASEVAVWEVWTVPFGSEPSAARGPSQAFGRDERGWDEALIAELAAVYEGAPAYVRVAFGRDVFEATNCEEPGGGRNLVHYFDVAAGSWRTPEELGFGPACSPEDWKA